MSGTCEDGRTGSGECACSGSWQGVACDTCPPGWAGDDCDVCDAGYHPSDADCIVDEPTACQGAAAAADHYVDPVLGFDDPNYGGGAGACAFRSVGYALSRATGKVLLAPGTHPVTEVLELLDGHELECDPDDPGVLSGQPEQGTSHLTVLMNPGSALRHCVVRGEGMNGYCVRMLGAATVEDTELDDCGGAAIRAAGTDLTIIGNEFSSSYTGIHFSSGGEALITGNVFHGAGTNVNCNVATTITGTGNVRTNDDATLCAAVCACPEGFGL